MKNLYIIILVIIMGTNVFAQNIEITPVDFNSSKDDFNSALVQNAKYIFYTSARSGNQQKIFYVEKTSSGYSAPKALNDEVNSGTQTGSITVTPDGLFMIFAAFEHSKTGQGRTDLFSARKVNGDWTDVRNLGPNVNSDSWDSQPALTSDGNTLYFVSDRPGGKGGTDIYVSKKTKDGWSKATNVGSPINTDADELTPVIAADNKTFTFASNRPGGFGGTDIYISRLNGSIFADPKNAEEPINTAGNEYYYFCRPNSNVAYFSSDKSGGEGGLDIYMAVPNPYESDAVVLLSGTVRDAVTNDPLGSDITLTDLKTGKKIAEFRSDDKSGEYFVVLQPGKNYSITASRKGYVFYSERFEVSAAEKGHEETKDINLTPVEGGVTRLLIFFDYDKATLKDESIGEMERVIEFLKDNPGLKIKLEGHTDDQGSDDYNVKLSTNRANAVKEYIVKAGIDAKRIQTVGYGKKKPLVNEKTEEARSSNRRVEMKII